MKAHLALACLLFGSLTAPLGAATRIVDSTCPLAVAPITAFLAVDTSNVLGIQLAADAVAKAYLECASRAISDNAIEPAGHWDQVRAAQHEVIVGRAAARQGLANIARASFMRALTLADGVAEWRTGGLGYITSNEFGTTLTRDTGTHLTSRFHDTAVDVRNAAEAELEKLGPAPSPNPSL